MKNILTTIPRSKFPNWATAERVCKKCDGVGYPHRSAWFWLVNCTRLPTQSGPGAVCFMIFDGKVRGYFDIVDTDQSENWRGKHEIGKARTTQCLVLANWHPYDGPEMPGFQGYRYTELRP